VTIPETVAHLERVVGGLARPPILMGHSAGGFLVQALLDRGVGAAGVAIDSAPPEGVLVVPLSQLRSFWPILRNPANRHRAVGFTPAQFHYAFTNTLSEEASAKVYERYHIPAPGRWVWGSILANVTPGHQESWVNFANDARAPLLFIAGGVDHIMAPAVNRSNAKHYEQSKALTEYKEFPGRSQLPLHGGAGRLGGGRRLRPRLGRRARRARRCGRPKGRRRWLRARAQGAARPALRPGRRGH
jgi:pimeloyl-ACP methyl ester carboxylesterase